MAAKLLLHAKDARNLVVYNQQKEHLTNKLPNANFSALAQRRQLKSLEYSTT